MRSKELDLTLPYIWSVRWKSLIKRETRPCMKTRQDTIPFCLPTLVRTVQYSTAQYSTAQYSTVQYNTVQHSTVQHSTVQHSTVQYSTAQHSTAQHSTAQHSTAQHGGTLVALFRPPMSFSALYVLSYGASSSSSSSSSLFFFVTEIEEGKDSNKREPYHRTE